MQQVFFIYGYLIHSWDEWGSSTKYKIIDILDCNTPDMFVVSKTIKETLLAGIEKKELEKELVTGGEGDLGGNRKEFHGEFFSRGELGKTICSELNADFQKILGEIFVLPKS